jgi:hypothetical protein
MLAVSAVFALFLTLYTHLWWRLLRLSLALRLYVLWGWRVIIAYLRRCPTIIVLAIIVLAIIVMVARWANNWRWRVNMIMHYNRRCCVIAVVSIVWRSVIVAVAWVAIYSIAVIIRVAIVADAVINMTSRINMRSVRMAAVIIYSNKFHSSTTT